MARGKDIDYSRLHDISVEEVKACPTFAHMSDQQAKEVIEMLKLLTKITYDVYKNTLQNH